MKLMNIMEALDKTCPFSMQEGFDNSGLQVGDTEKDCQKILLAFDFTEEVLEEAIAVRADVIITHHPFLFTPLKSISTAHWKGRQIFGKILRWLPSIPISTKTFNSALAKLWRNDFVYKDLRCCFRKKTVAVSDVSAICLKPCSIPILWNLSRKS